MRKANGPYEPRTVLVETPQIPQGQRTLPDTLQGECSIRQDSIVDYDPTIQYCENFESIDEPQVRVDNSFPYAVDK